MEKFYMKGFLGPREWCSEKINFKSYFENYSQALNKLSTPKKKLSEIDILQHIVPQSNQLSEKQLATLIDTTSGEILTELCDEDVEKKPIINNEPVPSTSSNAGKDQDTSLDNEGFRKLPNRVAAVSCSSNRREIIVNPTENAGRKDLVPRKHFIVSFRIHEAFQHKCNVKSKARPGHCVQQIWLLGHHKLTDLRDKIICPTDYQDVRGDISNCPDTPSSKKAIDLYPSSMFYIDNTFYIDKRNKVNVDYSKTVKEWGKDIGIEFGKTRAMENTSISELEVRMGYPYLFMHQGCCEHLIIINDARLVTGKDSLYSRDYPLVSRVIKRNMTYCMTCSRFPVRWIVKDCDRLAHDPTFQCENCFRMFHYINGKKVGNFKAYLYLQRASIC